MTQTVSGAAAVTALLRDAMTPDDAGVAAAAPQTAACRVPPDLLLGELLLAVDDLVPYAPELAALRRRLWAWQNPPDGAAAPSEQAMARRTRGVELAWTMTVTLGPALRQLAGLNTPGRYLVAFDLSLRQLLWNARRAYCTAIAEALAAAPPHVIEHWQDEGGRWVGVFSSRMQELYLRDPRGLEGEIVRLGEAVGDLVALRAERGSDALATRAADAEVGVPMTPLGAEWFLRSGLLADLELVRDYPFADIAEKFLRFSQRLSGIGLAVGILGTRERLSWLADQPVLLSDAADRIDADVLALASALTFVEQSIAAHKALNHVQAQDAQRSALQTMAAVAGRAGFQSDLDDIASTIQLQQELKAVAVGVAIAAATAVTAGAAGAAAGMALATVVDATTTFGALVVAAGVVSTRVLWETVVARSGSELLLGPQSIQGSSFLEDLGWQALQTAVVRAVLFGSGDILKAVAKVGSRAEGAAKFAVEQIATFGFGEVQSLVKTGRLRTLREEVLAVVQQAASTGTVALGGLLLSSFADRLGTARGALTVAAEQRLQQLDAERAQVAADFGAVRDGTATPEQFRSWAARAATAWNGLVELVAGMSAGAEKDAAMGRLVAAKGEIELRLAELGISATLSLPDATPLFEGLLPGLVAFGDDAQPVLDATYPSAVRRSTDIADAVLTSGSGGRRLLLLPAGDLPAASPHPSRLVHVPEASAQPGTPDQPLVQPGAAAEGLARLQGAMGPPAVTAILAQARPGQVEAFLRLVGHPELAGAGAVQARATALKGLASDPDSVAFGRRWGPLLALHLRRRLGTQATLGDGLLRADTLLRGAVPADRGAIVARLMGLRSGQLRRELSLSPPLRAPRRRITPENLGVDRDHPQWITLFDEVQRDFTALPLAQQGVMADCLQILEVAATGAFDGYQPQSRLGVIVTFEEMMTVGRIRELLPAIVANGLRGRLAEHVFLGPLAVLQQTMWLGGARIYAWTTGRSNLDAHWLEAGLTAFGELKSDDVHLMTPADQVARAEKYLLDARGDFENIPGGSSYYLWFIRDPGDVGRLRMLDILMRAGSPITGVFFGPQTPAPFPR